MMNNKYVQLLFQLRTDLVPVQSRISVLCQYFMCVSFSHISAKSLSSALRKTPLLRGGVGEGTYVKL